MDYTDEFNASNEQLKKLDRESLHKELNQMSLDELQNRMNWCTHQSMEVDDYLTEEELNHQIQLLMDRIENEEVKRKAKQQKTVKIKKVAILAAAIVVVVSVFSLAAIASKNHLNIKNSVIEFFHDTVSIRFFGDETKEDLTLTEVLNQLHDYGFDNLSLPAELFSDSFLFSQTNYSKQECFEQIQFRTVGNNIVLSIRIMNGGGTVFLEKDFKGLKSAATVENDGFNVYVFEFKDGRTQISYTKDGYSYELYGEVPIEKMIKIAESV